jgi:hypothetical protein
MFRQVMAEVVAAWGLLTWGAWAPPSQSDPARDRRRMTGKLTPCRS